MWKDQEGIVHQIPQAEGVEQDDPLSPLLFSLAIHAALRQANEALRPGEYLFAFLDDVYLLCSPDRAVELFRVIEGAMMHHTGISCNLGKTRIWNRSGVKPEGVDALGAEVWVGGHERDAETRGLKLSLIHI